MKDDDRRKSLEEELKLAKERFNLIFKNTTISVWDYYYDSKEIVQPERSMELHGFDTIISNVPESLIESGYVHESSVEAFRKLYEDLLNGAEYKEGTFLVQNQDRTGYWYEHISYTAVEDKDGRKYAAVGISTDVSAEIENKEEIKRWKALTANALGKRSVVTEFDLTADVFINIENPLIPMDGERVEKGFDRYIDLYTESYVYKPDSELVKSKLRRSALMTDFLDGRSESSFEFRMDFDGKIYWLLLSIKMIKREVDDHICVYLLHSDISDQKSREMELQRKADTDPLTEILNHRAFMEQANTVFERQPERYHTLFTIDVDDFKEINDTYGHATGDRLLCHIAATIAEPLGKLNKGILVGRIGGDEFAVVLPNCHRNTAKEIVEKIINDLKEPMALGIRVPVSAGVAVFPGDGKTFDELLMAADRALYHIKGHGKSGYSFYDEIEDDEKWLMENRQRMLLSTVSGGMMGGYIEEGFPFFFIDEKMLSWLGYDSEAEFVHDIDGLIENCIHPEDRDFVSREVEKQLHEGKQYKVDYRMQKKDGNYIWVHDIGEEMTAPDGRAAITSVCYDITSEKEHDKLLHRLVNDAKGSISLYRFEENGSFSLLMASENVGDLCGRSYEEYKSICDEDENQTVYEKDRDIVYENKVRAVVNDTVTSVNYRIPTIEGKIIWITGTFSKLGEDGGRPVLRAVYTPLPIQYELQLKTLNSNYLGVYAVDRETREVYYANETVFRLFNIERTEVAGHTCYELFTKEDCTCKECAIGKTGEKSFYRHVEDKILHVEMDEQFWNNRPIEIVYVRDVTEQLEKRKQENELLNRIPVGICLYKLSKGEIEPVVFNDVIKEVLGSDVSFMNKDTVRAFYKDVHPDDKPILHQHLKNIVKGTSRSLMCSYRMWNHKRGEYIWIESHSNIVRQEDEILIYTTYADISDIYHIQSRLRNTQVALNGIVKYGNLGIWNYNITTKQLTQEFSDYGAYGYEQVVENVPDSFIETKVIYPEDGLIYKECYDKIISGKEESDCVVRVFDRNACKYLWMHIYLLRRNALQDGNHRALGFSIVVNDEIESIKKLEQAQEELKQSKEIIETACSFADIWLFSYDIESGIIDVGEKLQKEFGFPERMENFPQSILDYGIINEEYVDFYIKQFEMLKGGTSEIVFEIKATLQDKKEHWLRFRGKVLDNLSLGRKMATVSAQVIDTEKMMESRLNKAKEKQQKGDQKLIYYFVANLSEGVVEEYRGERIATPQIEERMTLANFLNMYEESLLSEMDIAKIKYLYNEENLIDKYQKGTVLEEYDLQMQFDDGTITWTKHVLNLLRKPDSMDILLYEYVYDVNEEQIMEALLEFELSSGYEAIGFLNVSEDYFTVIEKNEEEDIDKRNSTFSEYMFKYAKTKIHPNDRERFISHYLDADFNALIDSHKEIIYRVKEDQDVRYQKGEIYCFTRDDRLYCILTRRDYTDVIRTEEQEKERLADALAKAEDAGQAKTEFLARMSHDMRTPMNAIKVLTALTLDSAENAQEVRNNMVKINSAGDYMLGLVNDILDMSKLEESSLKLNEDFYRYSDFIANMRSVYMPECEAKGISLTINEIDEALVVKCDSTRLNQVFYNVFSNAVKYTMPGGSIEYMVKATHLDENRVHMEFQVADTGIGMSEEFQERMFEPFARENTKVTAELSGSGLGLSITKQLVELMGGELFIESKQGVGTTVKINMDFKCAKEGEDRLYAYSHIMDESKILVGKQVLLAEDHPLNAEITRKLLEKRGMNVIHSANGREAVNMFKASKEGGIDVILMDIRMPEMDGLEATRAIRGLKREDAKKVPILAMSANAYPEDVQKSLESGMNAHLAKPIDIDGLFQTLIDILKTR